MWAQALHLPEHAQYSMGASILCMHVMCCSLTHECMRSDSHHRVRAILAVKELTMSESTLWTVHCAVCRFKPYWVPLAAMYNATSSSSGLNQGGHRGLARVKAVPGSASLASPSEYEADSFRTESDDTESVQSDATYDGSNPGRKSGRGGAVAAVLLAFCAGAIVGALAYRGHERRTVETGHNHELVTVNSDQTHELLQQQSSVSRGDQTPR